MFILTETISGVVELSLHMQFAVVMTELSLIKLPEQIVLPSLQIAACHKLSDILTGMAAEMCEKFDIDSSTAQLMQL